MKLYGTTRVGKSHVPHGDVAQPTNKRCASGRTNVEGVHLTSKEKRRVHPPSKEKRVSAIFIPSVNIANITLHVLYQQITVNIVLLKET